MSPNVLKIGIPKRLLRNGHFRDKYGLQDGADKGLRKFSLAGDRKVFVLSARDVAGLVHLGLLDAGITYSEWLLGRDDDFEILGEVPGYSARVAVLVPKDCGGDSLEGFLGTRSRSAPLRVALEHTHLQDLVRARLQNRECSFLQVFGSVEGVLPEFADAAVDCVETGNSMRAHELKEIEVLHQSRLVLFVKRRASGSDDSLRAQCDFLLQVLAKPRKESICALRESAAATKSKSGPSSEPRIPPFVRYSQMVYGGELVFREPGASANADELAAGYLLAQHSSFSQLTDRVIFSLEVFDSVFENVVGYRDHIYFESVAEILSLLRRLELDYRVDDSPDLEAAIAALASCGFVYHFHLPRKFIGLSPRSGQVRCSSWGREYSRSILCAPAHASSQWRERRSSDQATLHTMLLPCREIYRKYLGHIKLERFDLELARKLRDQLPVRVLV